MTGISNIVLTFICIPICYNVAKEKLEEKSKFELKCSYLKALNYGIGALFGGVFLILLVQLLV